MDSGDNLAQHLNQKLLPNPIEGDELRFLAGQSTTIAKANPKYISEQVLQLINDSHEMIRILPEKLTGMCAAAGIHPRVSIEASNAATLVTKDEIRYLAMIFADKEQVLRRIEAYVKGDRPRLRSARSEGATFQSRFARL